MGYFPNSDAGIAYEEQWCDHCVHQKPGDGGCAVWFAHMLHNHAECNKPDSILHLLIPKSADGLGNEQCSMFHPLDAGRCTATPDMFAVAK